MDLSSSQNCKGVDYIIYDYDYQEWIAVVTYDDRRTAYHIDYDDDNDVLYVSIGRACPGYGDVINDNIIVRRSFKTQKVVGYTFVWFKSLLEDDQFWIILKSLPRGEEIYEVIKTFLSVHKV